MDWLLKRSKEASTYGGIGLLALGLGEIFKIKEAPAVADAVTAGGTAFAESGNWINGLIIGGLGLLSAFKSDGDKGF